MRERHWTAHLRLLPGGDTDVASGLLGSAVLFGIVFVVCAIPALAFYRRLGFEAYGPEFLDAGIAHRNMRLDLA